MVKLAFFICLLPQLLGGQTGQAGFREPIRAIYLNVDMLQNNPDLLATDTIGIIVEANCPAYFRLLDQGETLHSGQLLAGQNPLSISRQGLLTKTAAYVFILELKSAERILQKKIIIRVKAATDQEQSPLVIKSVTTIFTLEMFKDNESIGFRKKTMTDLITQKTGLVVPRPDPGLTGSAIRDRPSNQSIGLVTLAMGIAKYLAEKRTAAMQRKTLAEAQKKKMTVSFSKTAANGENKKVSATIELEIN
jgi:hypothetical protein